MNTKQDYETKIKDYFMSDEYITFRDKYINRFDYEDSINRINSLKLTTINKVFNFIYDSINEETVKYYKYKFISNNSIIKETGIKSQVITFIFRVLLELEIISKSNHKSDKYKLNQIKIKTKDIMKLTFDEEIFKYIQKQNAKLRQQKSRALKNNKSIKSIEDKINELNNYKDIFTQINIDGGITRTKYNEKYSLNTGRKSSYFTTINKEYRPFIRINGNKVINTDIVASQPTLLANDLMNRIDYKDKEDVKLFYKICTEQDIYKYIADNMNISRDEAKDYWMIVAKGLQYLVYVGDNEVYEKNKKSKEFFKMFPNVIKFMDSYKDIDPSDTGLFSNYLCKLESKVVNSISELLDELGYINETVYDEFIYEEQNKDKVNKIILQYLMDNNIKVQIKINK